MKAFSLLSFLFIFCYSLHSSIASNEQYCKDCLLLTPLIRNGSIEEARRLSEVNPTKFADITSYSGFITVNEEYQSNMFFWYIPVEKDPHITPLIVWLQGGPGYTSLKGLFDIIGPFQLEDGEVTKRPVTWASDYSLLFIDQPVGTGYSFTQDERGYVDNEDDAGAQMYECLTQFLEIFTELESAPLFIMGESYAGKYVPALAIQIHRHKEKRPLNLKGIAIGNGLIDPESMMHYNEFTRIIGLLDDKEVEVLKVIEQDTIKAIQEKRMLDAALGFNKTVEYIKKHSGVSLYNFNMEQGGGAPEFEDFVQRHDIRRAIHVGNATFDLDNQVVYEKMQPDMMNTTKPWVEELLEHYGVMCYSGQLDVILPYGLSRNLYAKLNWSRRKDYIKAPRRRLRNTDDSSIVAFKKSGGNFADVLIRKAGHMVPSEQPDVAKFVIDNFIQEFNKTISNSLSFIFLSLLFLNGSFTNL